MRISDWSSDVCSSDLRGIVARRELSWPLEAAAFLSCVYFGSSGWFAYTPADMSNPVAIGTILSTAAYFYFAVSPGSLTGRLLSGPTMAYLGTVSYSLYLVHPYTYYAMRMLFVERSEEHTSELQSLMRISYAVFCLKKKKQ